MTDLPHLLAGVYQHYKGPLYLVLGYGHDADAEQLVDLRQPRTGDKRAPMGARDVVVYVGLTLDDAHDGPRLAVRTAKYFTELVCGVETCQDFGDHGFGEGTCPAEHAVPRFTYAGPSYSPGMRSAT